MTAKHRTAKHRRQSTYIDGMRPQDILTPVPAGPHGADRIELLFDGAARLERLLALINGAIRSIDLVMYIFEGDSAGTDVLDALARAARRGVRVRAVIDSFGSSNTSDGIFVPLRETMSRRSCTGSVCAWSFPLAPFWKAAADVGGSTSLSPSSS